MSEYDDPDYSDGPDYLRETMIAKMFELWLPQPDEGRWAPVKEMYATFQRKDITTKDGKKFLRELRLEKSSCQYGINWLTDAQLLELFILTIRRYSQQR